MAEKKNTENALPANPEALQGRVRELREKVRKLRFDQAVGQLDDPSQIRKTRRELARVLTALGGAPAAKA